MKLFLRTMLITWVVMASLALLALSHPSAFVPSRDRVIPIRALETCAKEALQQNHIGDPQSLPSQEAPCPRAQLVAVGIDPAEDLTGRALSHSDVRTERLAEYDGFVVTNTPENMVVAFRMEPTPGHGYIYLATIRRRSRCLCSGTLESYRLFLSQVFSPCLSQLSWCARSRV